MTQLNIADPIRFNLLRERTKANGETARVVIERAIAMMQHYYPEQDGIGMLSELTGSETRNIKDVISRNKEGMVWRVNSLTMDVLSMYKKSDIALSLEIIKNENRTPAQISEPVKATIILDELKTLLGLDARANLLPLVNCTIDNMKRVCKTTPNSFGWRLARHWINTLSALAQSQ